MTLKRIKQARGFPESSFTLPAGLLLSSSLLFAPAFCDGVEPGSDLPPLETAAAAPGQQSGWRFSVGAMRRQVKECGVRAGSYSQFQALRDRVVPGSWRCAHGVGGTEAATPRVYADGYVGTDDWTDFDGTTWNWGYDSGSQIQGSRLALTGVDRGGTTFLRQRSAWDEQASFGEREWGWVLRAERTLLTGACWEAGLSLDAGRASFGGSESLSNFRDTQEWTHWQRLIRDEYDISGTGLTANDPPYRGNETTVGPTIDNIPQQRAVIGRQTTGGGSYEAFNRIHTELDLDLTVFSLGLSGALRLWNGRLRLGAATGPTLNLLEAEGDYAESLYERQNGAAASELNHWHDSTQRSVVRLGYFAQVECDLRVWEPLELGLFARYDLAGGVSGDLGPARYRIDPEGSSLGGMVRLSL